MEYNHCHRRVVGTYLRSAGRKEALSKWLEDMRCAGVSLVAHFFTILNTIDPEHFLTGTTTRSAAS